MLAITLADLRFRLRQFLIAVVGAGVVFAMALLLTGMVKGFYNEVTRTVASANADVWVLPEGTSGPFTSVRSFPESTVARLARVPGVEQASGMAISLQTVNRAGSGLLRAMVIGSPIGSPAQVVPTRGREVRRDREAVADDRLHLAIGETFDVGGRTFKVVGLTHGMTMLGGTPDIWISLPAAQAVLFRGAPLVTSAAVRGHPEQLPAGLAGMEGKAVEVDSMGVMKDAVDSVNNSRYLMWAVAAIIVAALVYVSALQRTRDFAVMKAVGASSRLLFLGVAAQAVLVSLGAAMFAAATSWMFRPVYTVPVEVPLSAFLLLPVVAVVVGVLSSLVALKQALDVDPALAFGAA
jgi:putative ABC transport system permease protein